ncbi:mitochondrial import inner membrane translocase subunit Tim21 isoform X2 [Enoplosus armatus]|uniref:mitochondrial import inner membrane translocase subunit Tim21 isoform X2 n=1 Tax=Enoplosus armatus TaxID=215367 RepID=UPI003994D6F4
MAYTQILKALHRNLQQTATQYSLLHHTHRTVSTVSRLTLRRRAEAPSSVQAALSCFIQAQTRRGLSLDSAARNKSSPEERDNKSVYRYQSGSPKPSAAQKGGLLYVVFQELFSSSSPNKVYGKAFNKVKLHPEVIGAFGEPIKCYGETTRRGRRQQVSHMEYLKDGLKHMRLTFYIEGSEPGLKGTVHSESKENPETGKYEFRYIFVDIDTYPRRTIIVEDNR